MKSSVIVSLLIFYLSIMISACTIKSDKPENKTIALNDNWFFNMEGDEQVYPAIVPGTVHTDLLANDKIPQPFYRDNEKQCQWIDKKNWVYTKKFTLDSSDLKFKHIYIDFKGLDTYAEVFLNDSLIITANNMFRSWQCDITSKLRSGENVLKVLFISPITIGLEALKQNGYPLPAVNDQSEVGELGKDKISVFTRKAPYHYGWDWGPRFVTMGIWRPVELHLLNKAEITDIYIKQKSVQKEKAELSALISIKTYREGTFQVELTDAKNNKYATSEIEIKSDTIVEFNFTIDQPELWWPNGYGEQNLYEFKARLSNSTRFMDEKTLTTGLRDIKVIIQPDSQGKSFYFQVNGVPVFAKGANYIPNDNFLPRVTAKKYEEIVSSAAAANMNMLRVWGGGIYENDVFYNLCDKYGILLWHDFMFACSMYPGDNEFLSNVKEEFIDNIIRLRNHPSIALWCGNNEIDVAWCNEKELCGWSWKQQYSKEHRAQIWKAYDTIFHSILPEVIKKEDGIRFYWPSSPLADWGKTATYSTTSGDMHYWGVWHGSEPFEKFEEVKARFMSEYGFQSFPEMNTVKEYTLPQDWDIYSDVMLAHQRSPIGNKKIKEYLEMYYPLPDEFEEFLYVGQVLQAFGIKHAIDYHRINKPYCMGTLFWQLNDCWPGASWSSIDYYTNWKALQYKARDAYEPLRLAAIQKNNTVDVYVLNDKPDVEKGKLELTITDFYGKILYSQETEIKFDFDSSTKVYSINLNKITPEIPVESSMLKAELFVDNKKIDAEIHYFVKPKNLKLPSSTLKYNLEKKADRYILDFEATNLEKDVAFYIPGVSANYSDNYFDLLPGEKREIAIELKTSENDVLKKGIIIHTLNSVYAKK